MSLDTLRTRCLSLPGVTEDIKWGDNLVFSVGGKMFVLVDLEPPYRTSFKCDPETLAELVEREGVVPAPYLARAGWVMVESLDDVMEWPELSDRIGDAYRLARAKLPKRVRAGFEAAESSDNRPRRPWRLPVARPRRR